MGLSNKEIQHIANLARLHISDEEISVYKDQIESILDYVKKLQDVDTEGISELAHAVGLSNVLGKDKVIQSDKDTKDLIIENFPQKEGDLLSVQAVFEGKTE